ncbi:MAG: hypothetical protein ACKO2G_16495 [Verrucomicrobiales bacterium]
MKCDRDSGEDVLAAVLMASGVNAGCRHAILRRDGRVLLALPEDRETAAKTLQLYQPQKTKAKVVARCLEMAVNLGLYRFLLPSHVTVEAGVAATRNPKPVGVLVGSSGHLCERAVTLSQRDGAWEVAKFASGPDAGSILSNEASMLQLLQANSRVPELIALETSEAGVMLRMKLMEGMSWEGEAVEPILEILNELRLQEEWRPLEGFLEWQWIKKGFSMANTGAAILEHLSTHKVPVSIRHGDLTRPNLRVGADEKLIVHDWERGAPEGAVGFDLAHFITQDVLFRGNYSPDEAVTRIRRNLSTSPAREWLEENGWAGRSDQLLAANLALNTGAGYLDQREWLVVLLQTADSLS